jgi:hypothetical protein
MQYYNVNLRKCVKLSQNPIININAHGHLKNHPNGYDQTKYYIEQFNLLPDDKNYSMYPTPLHLDVAATQLNLPIDQFHDINVMNQILLHTHDDYNKIFELCEKNKTKLIFIAQDTNTVLYHQTIRQLDRFATNPGRPTSIQQQYDEFQNLFFNQSATIWNKLNLIDTWDVRERMALDMRPFDGILDHRLNFQSPHLWINCQELWTNTADTLEKIMGYLGLEIALDKWDAWMPISYAWQKIQLKLLDFCFNQKHIVEAVVNNWDYKINLTFQQEVIIQHCLIYQYGLNLKTWQLEKFPSNTQELHRLLEPNIHPIQDIYLKLNKANY